MRIDFNSQLYNVGGSIDKTVACKIDYYINYIEQLDFLVMINIWLLST